MGYETEIAGAIGVLIFAGVLIGFLLFCFSYLSKSLIDYNESRAAELKKKQEAENRDRELITQAKKHTHKYTESFVKDLKNIKNEYDFDVDFNVNLKNSIVRTEVVYAE